jgi:hypothetical protein
MSALNEKMHKWDAPYLQEENIPFARTHDLSVLLDLLLPVAPSWSSLRPTLDALTTYAVEFRYPGISASQTIATQAFQDCAAVRGMLRQYFSLQ